MVYAIRLKSIWHRETSLEDLDQESHLFHQCDSRWANRDRKRGQSLKMAVCIATGFTFTNILPNLRIFMPSPNRRDRWDA
jgi:hypothetical protein